MKKGVVTRAKKRQEQGEAQEEKVVLSSLTTGIPLFLNKVDKGLLECQLKKL